MNQNSVQSTNQHVVLCGLGPELCQLEEEANDRALSVRRANDAPLLLEYVLENRLSPCYSGVVMTLDLATQYLRPLRDVRWSLGSVPFLVLLPTTGSEDEFCGDLLMHDAAGLLPKGTDMETVQRALVRAKEGELWVTRKTLSSTFRRAIQQMNQTQFSPREREILERVANGDTNQAIAEALFVTRETVRWHLRSLYTKLGVHDRNSIAEYVKRTQSHGHSA